MIVLTLKARARSPEAARQICRIFSQSLTLHQEPGWLRGSCMMNVNDPAEVLILQEWGTRAALEAWRNSTSRGVVHDQSAPYIETEFVETEYQD